MKLSFSEMNEAREFITECLRPYITGSKTPDAIYTALTKVESDLKAEIVSILTGKACFCRGNHIELFERASSDTIELINDNVEPTIVPVDEIVENKKSKSK